MADKNSVGVGKNLAVETSESPRPAPERTRQWIEDRYGPIILEERGVRFGPLNVRVQVASVVVYHGSAIGLGATDDAAIEALKRDLFCHPPVTSEDAG